MLRSPHSGKNKLFQHLFVQKAEKGRKSKTIDTEFSKKIIFLKLHQNAGGKLVVDQLGIPGAINRLFYTYGFIICYHPSTESSFL